jgi:hypothetical protein
MTVREYIRTFETLGAHLIGVPAPCSVTGSGYQCGYFEDGAVAVVDDPAIGGRRVLDWIEGELTFAARDTMSHAARCVATVPQSRRAQIVQEAGCKPGAVIVIDGVRWAHDGGYRGINWA